MSSLHFSWQSAVLKSGCESTTKYVLLVVGTFMNQHGDGCFPSYGKISEFSSLGRSTVIKHVNEAARLGWLSRKRRPKGNMDNDSNWYEISFPVAAPGIPGGLGVVHTVDQGGIPGGPALVHVVDPNTPMEHPNEHKTRKPRVSSSNSQEAEPKEKTVTASELFDEYMIDAELAKAFILHRRSKKAKLTMLAWKGFIREAEKAGWDLNDAIRKTIERNWVGFEAEWVAPKGGKAQQGHQNAPGSTDGDWWESAQEVERAAAEKGVKRKPGEEFYWFKCRVAKACKERRWMDLILADLLRTKSSHYARVYEYFNGTPPMEGI